MQRILIPRQRAMLLDKKKVERKQISDDDIMAMFKYLMEERQKTNSMLEDLTSKIKQG